MTDTLQVLFNVFALVRDARRRNYWFCQYFEANLTAEVIRHITFLFVEYKMKMKCFFFLDENMLIQYS